jgi:hypothetical protein
VFFAKVYCRWNQKLKRMKISQIILFVGLLLCTANTINALTQFPDKTGEWYLCSRGGDGDWTYALHPAYIEKDTILMHLIKKHAGIDVPFGMTILKCILSTLIYLKALKT